MQPTATAGAERPASNHQARPLPDAALLPLDRETREVLPTVDAARHLLRQPQTLRWWACMDNGPIRPVRINGRLGWRTAEIRALIAGGVKA